jgi:RNA polymerase subunit RPABC4/transcription elongation factor Spt4
MNRLLKETGYEKYCKKCHEFRHSSYTICWYCKSKLVEKYIEVKIGTTSDHNQMKKNPNSTIMHLREVE